jgi:hypothetical protein
MADKIAVEANNALQAGAAGGGFGTIVAGFVSLMNEGPVRQSLMILTPLITVTVSGLWLFLKVVVDRAIANALLKKALADVRTIEEEVLSDPNSSDEHKRRVRKMVEDAEELRMQTVMKRIDVKLLPM